MRAVDAGVAMEERHRRAVLDTRSATDFAAGHLAGSGHIPLPELAARRTELPPRGAPILVVAEGGTGAREAAEALDSLGYADVLFLEAPLDALPRGLADRAPARRLWRPAPFLEEALARLFPPDAGGAPGPGAGAPRALDVACGAGRDSVHLALQGFEVEAWDHDPDALARARDLAARHGVALRTVLCDLERRDVPAPGRSFDLVICFRFLHRPLFPWIARAVAPGGWLVYETYREGQERYGRPRRQHFLLASGELAGAFPDLVTIRYEELEPAGGPVIARLIARRGVEAGAPGT
jgi:SAM-dependent methyltransferase